MDAIIFLLWDLYTASSLAERNLIFYKLDRFSNLLVPKQETYRDDHGYHICVFDHHIIQIMLSSDHTESDHIVKVFFQDEKNQLLTTNLWLNLVSFCNL